MLSPILRNKLTITLNPEVTIASVCTTPSPSPPATVTDRCYYEVNESKTEMKPNKACEHEFSHPAFDTLASIKCSDLNWIEWWNITCAIKLLQNAFGFKSNVSDRKAQNIQSFIHSPANISWALTIHQAQPIKKTNKQKLGTAAEFGFLTIALRPS